MAKIRAIDQAVVITSELTNEQLAKAVKYFPEVLTLKTKNDDDKLVPLFTVGVAKVASVSKFGIAFPQGAKDEKASITIQIDKLSKAKRTEFVKDEYGKVIMYLNLVEKAFADAEKAFDADYKALDDSIIVE
jgi:hypothetical protein